MTAVLEPVSSSPVRHQGAESGRRVPEQSTGPRRRSPACDPAESRTLVEAAQGGDKDAFGRLYTLYFRQVFAFICGRVTNTQTAQDLTADVFLRAYRRLGTYTWQGHDVGAWLVTIARNRVADHFKSGLYRFEIPVLDTGEGGCRDGADNSPEGRPERLVLDHLENVALLTALKQLSPEQYDVLVWRFVYGLSVAETAFEMGKLEGAVKALQYRAVRSMARLLPAGLGDDR